MFRHAKYGGPAAWSFLWRKFLDHACEGGWEGVVVRERLPSSLGQLSSISTRSILHHGKHVGLRR